MAEAGGPRQRPGPSVRVEKTLIWPPGTTVEKLSTYLLRQLYASRAESPYFS